MERVVFCAFLERDEGAYRERLPLFFPPADDGFGDETRGQGDEDGDGLPVLPDVPTEEPAGEGQHDTKRAKRSHEL